METVRIESPSKKYDIHLEKGQMNTLFFKSLKGNRKMLVVTDENVYRHYETYLLGIEVFVIKAGESSKNIHVYYDILTRLAQMKMNRSDLLVAFGGGVVGDLTGFVASTYMRGMGFVQIPTSLLAMVDSSVGGKVAINHENGKNLIGQFYQPDAVYIDVALLDTLPKGRYSEGMAEVIKYGLIKDAELFDYLANEPKDQVHSKIESVIGICVSIKGELVAQDETDLGVRQYLNFGHTIGHAIEAYYHYEKYTHGEAIAIGMAHKAKVAMDKGWISQAECDLIHKTFDKYQLPTELENPQDFKAILQLMTLDKKADGQIFKLIMIPKIGKAEIEALDFDALVDSVTRSDI